MDPVDHTDVRGEFLVVHPRKLRRSHLDLGGAPRRARGSREAGGSAGLGPRDVGVGRGGDQGLGGRAMSGPGFSDFLESCGRPVAYFPALAKALGSIKAAVFLAQLMYWAPRAKNPDGWVFKMAEEWETETGLTYEEQLGARKILEGLKLI